jgi:hypothetical protein
MIKIEKSRCSAPVMFVETTHPNHTKRCIAPEYSKTGYSGALHL